MCRVFLHPTTVRNPLDVTRVEVRTGLRAFWTGRHAELMETDDPRPRDWWQADEPATDYVGDGPKGAA